MTNLNLESHICQSDEWGRVKTNLGTPAVKSDSVQLTLHKIPYLPYFIGYCPKVDINRINWEGFKKVGKENKCVYIKIEPLNLESDLKMPAVKANLRKSKSIFAKKTILLDLTPSEEELLKYMKPKTRYNIKIAERNGVEVKERNDDEALEIFLKLQKETAKRQGFLLHPDNYYREVWQTLSKNGMAHLLIASYEDSPLTAWMLFSYKNILYYPYGGSSNEHKNVMANNLMMWEAIRFGKREGCNIFDMWGATDDESDPWYGFTRFKLGYGGILTEFMDSYDLILSPILYWPLILADKIRWLFLQLRLKVNL